MIMTARLFQVTLLPYPLINKHRPTLILSIRVRYQNITELVND